MGWVLRVPAHTAFSGDCRCIENSVDVGHRCHDDGLGEVGFRALFEANLGNNETIQPVSFTTIIVMFLIGRAGSALSSGYCVLPKQPSYLDRTHAGHRSAR